MDFLPIIGEDKKPKIIMNNPGFYMIVGYINGNGLQTALSLDIARKDQDTGIIPVSFQYKGNHHPVVRGIRFSNLIDLVKDMPSEEKGEAVKLLKFTRQYFYRLWEPKKNQSVQFQQDYLDVIRTIDMYLKASQISTIPSLKNTVLRHHLSLLNDPRVKSLNLKATSDGYMF